MPSKAICVFSGGLDSILSALIVKRQGIKVILLHFTSPFYGKDPKEIKKIASFYGFKIIIHKIRERYIRKVLLNPQYGFGKGINPCIDCHAYMFYIAGRYMQKLKADFICTGEVLGQRPKSQIKSALYKVEKLSGYLGYIVRPLSLQLLPPTIPEKLGLIKRENFYSIQGRSRKQQLELAKQLNITDYPTPAGGCLLTEHILKPRFKNLKKIIQIQTWQDLNLLKIGRHFFLRKYPAYMIISRNHEEGVKLQNFKIVKHNLDIIKSIPTNSLGAIAIILTQNNNILNLLTILSPIIARYSKNFKNNTMVKVRHTIFKNNKKVYDLYVNTYGDNKLAERYLIKLK